MILKKKKKEYSAFNEEIRYNAEKLDKYLGQKIQYDQEIFL